MRPGLPSGGSGLFLFPTPYAQGIMAKQVYDPKTGRMVWVDDKGRPLGRDPLGYDPGMGSLPGRALAREADLYARLPNARLAGYRGPKVTPPDRGAASGAPPGTNRPLAGLAQNFRGNSQVISPVDENGVAISDPIRRQIVQTPTEVGDDAEAITVVLGAELYPDAGALNRRPYFLHGEIEWGIGGASFSAEVDWQNGAIIPIIASFVKVNCIYTPQVTAGLASPDVIVSAAFGYGQAMNSGRGSSVRRTISSGTVNPGSRSNGGRPYPIPNFANGLTVQTDSDNPNLKIVWVTNGVYPALNELSHVYYTGNTNGSDQASASFQIPNGANFVYFDNLGMSVQSAQLIFSLGI